VGSRKITWRSLSHPWPSLEVGIRSRSPLPLSFPLHVLQSQQPQYAIVATTENSKDKHKTDRPIINIQQRTKMQDISTKKNHRKWKWELLLNREKYDRNDKDNNSSDDENKNSKQNLCKLDIFLSLRGSSMLRTKTVRTYVLYAFCLSSLNDCIFTSLTRLDVTK
jgi:hypothetical protein